MANIPLWDFEVYAPYHHAFGFRERWRLYRMARRLKRNMLAQLERDRSEKLAKELMTAEERAIEELLRS